MSVAVSFLLTSIAMVYVVFNLGSVLFTSFSEINDSWIGFYDRSEHRAGTDIDTPGGQSTQRQPTVRLTLTNSGSTDLARFENWDLIFELQREGAGRLDILYLTYTSTNPPSCNQWTVDGIYRDAAASEPETVGAGILNPGEDMVVVAKPHPSVGVNTYDRAVFSTPNGITAEVVFEVVEPQTTTLYVLDEADSKVYRYLDDGTSLGSDALDAGNGAAKGITTDLASFWTTDVLDDDVYRYTLGFALSSTSTQVAANIQGEGVTTDACNIWVVDEGTDKVYEYGLTGPSVSEFSLAAANANAAGITTDGMNIWVMETAAGASKVYKYAMTGDPVSDFSVAQGADGFTGIATNASNIWIVDLATLKIYKYDMDGVFVSDFGLNAENGDPQGLTVSPR